MPNNRTLVQDYMQAWAQADEAQMQRCMADDFRYNAPPGYDNGRAGHVQIAQDFNKAFPDLAISLEDWIETGNDIAVRFRCTGTHKNELWGLKATKQEVLFDGVSCLRIRNGKIVQDNTQFDMLGLLAQINALPDKLRMPGGQTRRRATATA